MSEPRAREKAAELMLGFVARTYDHPPRRYLWTDAFAVCNLLELAKAEGCAQFRELAVRLVDQVHQLLGRHRADDPRSGWISGLSSKEGEAHPTRGGLRIGKPLPERLPEEPLDAGLEWERDGQYFHYLTKWMHALDTLARRTFEPKAARWSRELAAAAHAAFTYTLVPGAPKRMFWKMSVDLKRPLVTSMGHHDPLDGLVTYLQLRAHRGRADERHDLAGEIAEMAAIVDGLDLTTDDPLALGGLMSDAHRIEQLARHSVEVGALLPRVLAAAVSGMALYLRQHPHARPARLRLAFRELGLTIGLHAVDRMWAALRADPRPFEGAPEVGRALARLVEHRPLVAAIESFWCEPENQQADSWTGHRDINEVMLATSLVPAGYLSLA